MRNPWRVKLSADLEPSAWNTGCRHGENTEMRTVPDLLPRGGLQRADLMPRGDVQRADLCMGSGARPLSKSDSLGYAAELSRTSIGSCHFL
jgi:hypothetical protein